MNPQLSADMTTLKAADHRMKVSMGADRFRAARSAIAAERSGGGRPAANSGNSHHTHEQQSASEDSDGSEAVLALVRQVGLPGFKSTSDGASGAGLTASERADLALLRKAGIVSDDR